ncbi:MAG: nucleoside deaminase [Rhodospirillales bacterium]|nr:nucleoside deaminase [Rhodospirillales bacterium]
MKAALEEAQHAAELDEVPIGAVIVWQNDIIARHGNRTRTLHDPSAHAEILAIREACQKLGAQRIPDCDLYVTLEPCTMCAAAISFARIKRLVIGAPDPKGGAVMNGIRFFEQPTCHHKKIDLITGLEEDACAQILKTFFQSKRAGV